MVLKFICNLHGGTLKEKKNVCTFPEVIFWFDVMTNDCLDTFQINHPHVILVT